MHFILALICACPRSIAYGPFMAGILAMAEPDNPGLSVRDLMVVGVQPFTGVFYDVHQWRIVVLLTVALLHPTSLSRLCSAIGPQGAGP